MNAIPFVPSAAASGIFVFSLTLAAPAQDWPQWLGAGRDGRAPGFEAPAEWPAELAQKWKVAIGDGVATPALVGNRLYTFSRVDDESAEVVRCLDVATGDEVWSDRYEVQGADGPARGFSGPRCSPAVADGKVVTLGLRGTVSCYDAATGKLLWRKDDYPRQYPRFLTSSSPVVAGGLCLAQLGGREEGGVIAYDLATGDEKWRWEGGGPDYASPNLLEVGGKPYLIAETGDRVVAVALADGKLAWETPFAVEGRGYNASTPVVDSDTVFYGGSNRGITAVKFRPDGDRIAGEELWKNGDNSVQYNTPVVKDGLLYALASNNELFCIETESGETAWKAAVASGGDEGGERPPGRAERPDRPEGEGRRPRGEGGSRRGGGGRGGYGTIVDAGSHLVLLTPAAELVVFKPGREAFDEVARVKVSESRTYAYPVLSGKRVIIKDENDLALYTLP